MPSRSSRVPDDPREDPARRWTTFNTKSLLGASLLGQKKYAEAEPLLVAGYSGLKQREAKIPEQVLVPPYQVLPGTAGATLRSDGPEG